VVSYELFTDAAEARALPEWASVPTFFNLLPDAATLAAAIPRMPVRKAPELPFVAAWEYSTFTADQRFYLPYVTEELKKAGVRFFSRHVDSLHELVRKEKQQGEETESGYDVVINCTGIGAGKLLGAPESVYPLRGQVLRIATPHDWLCAPAGSVGGDGVQLCINWPSSYIIPNQNSLVLGGTMGEPSNWDTTVSPEHTTEIRQRIASVFPALAEAPLISEWAGLRPCNETGVRLESYMQQQTLIVHCFGHGGSGVTLGYGCAVDVVDNHVLPHIKQRQS